MTLTVEWLFEYLRLLMWDFHTQQSRCETLKTPGERQLCGQTGVNESGRTGRSRREGDGNTDSRALQRRNTEERLGTHNASNVSIEQATAAKRPRSLKNVLTECVYIDVKNAHHSEHMERRVDESSCCDSIIIAP